MSPQPGVHLKRGLRDVRLEATLGKRFVQQPGDLVIVFVEQNPGALL